MKSLNFKAVFLNLLFAFLIAFVAAPFLEANPVFIAAVVFILGALVKIPKGVAAGALQHEIWVNDIEENLFAGNPHIGFSKNDDAFVEYKTVNLPQAGANAGIEKDRSVLPATISQRTDNILTYDLSEFTTDPTLITNLEELQTSYNKRSSVLQNHLDVINDRTGIEALFAWSSNVAAQQVRTSGDDSSANLPHTTATGARKKITIEDIRKMAELFDRQNVTRANRKLLMPPAMYYELFGIDALIDADKIGRATLPDGVINRLFDFDIMMRSEVILYNNAGVPQKKAIGSAEAADDTFSCLAWHPNYVRRALGDIKVFANEDKAEYYGSIFSALVMFGASKARSTDIGVGEIIQTVSA